MFCSVLSATIYGVDAVKVQVEADVSDGMPQFVMVGSVSMQVKEGQDRVKTALRNVGVVLPPKRITISLVPADIRKEGSRFDLPVAVAVLRAAGRIPPKALDGDMIIGEVRLNGGIQGVTGVLPTVLLARELGCKRCVIPRDNIIEGKIVEGIQVVGVESLEQLIRFCCEGLPGEEEVTVPEEEEDYEVDFQDIIGQEYVKRAALIAACGFHNLLLCGTPGSGKSMIAKRIPTIMPEMTREESLELSKIYSVAGLLPADKPILRRRPFREPHHTISPQALAGGGRIPVPGEITLAHHGVLFLDELAEVSRHTIEILRQPLEERQIAIARTGGRYIFSANFMLVGAMNPCPCGYYPDMNRCTCTMQGVLRYLNKISQPLLDRMDLCVEVPALSYETLTGDGKRGESSKKLRKIVERVQQSQRERYAEAERGDNKRRMVRYNSELTPGEIEDFCPVTRDGKKLLKQAFQSYGISARGYHRIIKVARTIADIEECEVIQTEHISEAICYRSLDKNLWMKG